MADRAEACNFRSQYYSKVDFKIVDHKKTAERLFAERIVDIHKLECLCLRPVTLNHQYRYLTWRVLLGLQSPVRGETTEEEYRKKEFEDLYRTSQELFNTSKAEDNTKNLLLCYRLKFGTIPFSWITDKNVDENLSSEDVSLLAIFSTMLEISENLCDSFWLATRFYQSSKKFRNQYDLLIDKVKITMRNEDDQVYEHINSVDLIGNLPIKFWFSSCFAQIFPTASLERIWDKIIAGSSMFMVNVTAALVLSFRRPLLALKSVNDMLQCFEQQLTENHANLVVSHALDMWRKSGFRTTPISGSDSVNRVLSQPVSRSIQNIGNLSLFRSLQKLNSFVRNTSKEKVRNFTSQRK
ncbi:DgyrCDS14189 [Dimorphilus gyrociliatus]|uniref:TBC1 domain family member 7 n=1 Tax=Dimorphilus gyrociliatus TaxID=2664684 RepID=A0A7I8WD86_9ANNE|nr:DgyrCDS14189 [Dimorphilus gyrociliatus]